MTAPDLTRPTRDTSWMADARCKGSTVDFVSESGTEIIAAQLVCLGCLVRDRCLDYALDRGEWAGVWGGLTPQGRLSVHRRRVYQAKRAGAR